jgi:hypothetical protein
MALCRRLEGFRASLDAFEKKKISIPQTLILQSANE